MEKTALHTLACWVAMTVALHVAVGAETPSIALLVLNKEGTLAIVDPGSRRVVATVRTGDMPHEAVASSDGKLAFVIDLIAQRELHRVDLGALRSPHGLAFAGGKLYFTAEANKAIGRYDPATNQVDWVLGTGQEGTHMVEVSEDLQRIFTANIGSDSISIFERAGAQSWSHTVIPVGKVPEGFALTPDGKELWAAHSRDGGISVIDVASKRVVQTL